MMESMSIKSEKVIRENQESDDECSYEFELDEQEQFN